MGFGNFIEDIGEKEGRLESLSEDIKSKLGNGAGSVELLDEEKELEDAVLDLEKETLQLLSKEVDNRRVLFKSNKEFIKWYNSSVKELSSLVEPYNELKQGLNYIVSELKSVNLEDGDVPIQILEWEKRVLEPANTIGKIVKDIEARRASVAESLDEPEKELVMDKDFAKKQKSEIKELRDIINDIENEQAAISKVISKNQEQVKEKFELERKELKTIEENLEKIQKLEAEFEHYEEQINKQKQELKIIDISRVLKNKAEITGENSKIERRVAKLFNIIEEPKGVEQSLGYLEEQASRGRFVENHEVVEQLEAIEDVESKTRDYVELFGEASEYVNLGEIISNRKRELVEWTGEEVKDKGDALISRRGFLKAAGATGLLGSLDALNNIKNLKSHGQDSFLSPGDINSANDEMIAEILNGDPGKVFIFDIYFKDQVDLDPESSKNFLYSSLNDLEGVNLDIEWIPIRATIQGYCENNNVSKNELRQSGSLESINNIISDFRTVVKDYGVLEEIPEELSYYGVGSEESGKLHETLFSHVLSMLDVSDQMYRDLTATETTIMFIGDFNSENFSGVSTDGRGTGKFALAKRFDNKTYGLNVVVHELGHKLRLPHSYSQDVMSYSVLATIAESKIRMPFGPESRLNWRKVRRNFEDF